MRYYELMEATTDQWVADTVDKLDDLEDKFKAKDFTKADEDLWKKLNNQLNTHNAKSNPNPTTPSKATKPTNNKKWFQELAEKYTFRLTATNTKLLTGAMTIKNECQPFLQQVGKNPLSLYRGIKSTKIVTKDTVYLKHRKPLDTPQAVHDYLNKYFTKQFGEPFRNAMFCTGNSYQAGEYGSLYYVFPIGELKYLWSPHIDDLYSVLEEFGFDDDNFSNSLNDLIQDVIYPGKYTTKNLSEAVASSHEIMIRTNSYYAIRAEVDGSWSDEIKNSPIGRAITEILKS